MWVGRRENVTRQARHETMQVFKGVVIVGTEPAQVCAKSVERTRII